MQEDPVILHWLNKKIYFYFCKTIYYRKIWWGTHDCGLSSWCESGIPLAIGQQLFWLSVFFFAFPFFSLFLNTQRFWRGFFLKYGCPHWHTVWYNKYTPGCPVFINEMYQNQKLNTCLSGGSILRQSFFGNEFKSERKMAFYP